MNLAAIKMEEKVIRSAAEPVARAVMDRVVPTLIKVYLLCVNQTCYIQTFVIDNTKNAKKESFPLVLSSVTPATRIIPV